MRIAGPAGTIAGSILLSVPILPSLAITHRSTTSLAPPSTATATATTAWPAIHHRSASYRYPAVADEYLGIDLIDHIEWRQSALGRTMRVYPTSWLRANGGSYTIGEAAWNELYDKYRSSVTRNLNGLRDQLICHVEHGAIKDTYNLDEWLANVGYDATVAADCQPGKDS